MAIDPKKTASNAPARKPRHTDPFKAAVKAAGAAILSSTKVSSQPLTYHRIYTGHGEVRLLAVNEAGAWQQYVNAGNGLVGDLKDALTRPAGK